MATTTNYGWQTPDDTDLVKDGASAMRTLGQEIDTTFADLKGGSSGQMLTKASNTDNDYAWVTPEIGDITAVVADTPLTGGGTSGSVNIGIQDGTTTQKGAVQLTDSTSSTSTTTAATPNAVKTSYDLAAAAIPKSTVTTAGDIIFRNGSAPTRLGIGTAGQVLQVNSGATAPEWATPSSGGGMTVLASGSLTGSSVSINSISASYNYIVLKIFNFQPASANQNLLGTLNSDTNTRYVSEINTSGNPSFTATSFRISQGTSSSTANGFYEVEFPNYANTASWKLMDVRGFSNNNATPTTINNVIWSDYYNQTTAISSIQLFCGSGNFTGGTYYLYGVK